MVAGDVFQGQHGAARPAYGVFGRHPHHRGQCLVDRHDLPVGAQDHDAVGTIFQDSGQAGALGLEQVHEAGIADCDSSLVGKPLEELPVKLCKGIIAAKQVNDAEHLVFKEQRQGDHLAKHLAQRLLHFTHLAGQVDGRRCGVVAPLQGSLVQRSECSHVKKWRKRPQRFKRDMIDRPHLETRRHTNRRVQRRRLRLQQDHTGGAAHHLGSAAQD